MTCSISALEIQKILARTFNAIDLTMVGIRKYCGLFPFSGELITAVK
ncbi:hypothetical protein [Candidatus Erwinia haradaeae]|nr:hypothetical protein [Candidatus Erwinia haradaeae]